MNETKKELRRLKKEWKELKKYLDFYGVNSEGLEKKPNVIEYFKFFLTKKKKLDSDPITDEEKKQVQEIMGMSDEEFNSMEIGRKWGCITVSTPSYTWMCLAGREWGVNLETGKKLLMCLS